MSFEQQSVGSRFDTQKRELEQILVHITQANDMLQKMRYINPNQLQEIKGQMKDEFAKIKTLVVDLDKQAKGDQKYAMKLLKQQISKQEEQHKQIVKDLVKQSVINSFNRLSLAEVGKSQSQENQFFVEPPVRESAQSKKSQSIQSQLSQQLLQRQSQDRESEMSIQKPLLDEDQHISSSNSKKKFSDDIQVKRDTEDLEAQTAMQLNQQMVEHKLIEEEQSKLDDYIEELDNLVDFQTEESKSKCMKLSIIIAVIVLLVLVIIFALLYFLL